LHRSLNGSPTLSYFELPSSLGKDADGFVVVDIMPKPIVLARKIHVPTPWRGFEYLMAQHHENLITETMGNLREGRRIVVCERTVVVAVVRYGLLTFFEIPPVAFSSPKVR